MFALGLPLHVKGRPRMERERFIVFLNREL
jgi:hypothetical protein